MSSFVISKRLTAFDIVNYTLLFLISFICIIPFIYVISVSFTDPKVYIPYSFYLVPKKLSLDAYIYILSSNSFIDALKSSTFVTLFGTLLNLFFTFTMAYGMTKKNLPFRRVIVGTVIFTLIFNAGIIPNYLLVKQLGLYNTYWSLILPVLTNAWSLIVVRSFMDAIPAEIEESAKIDGCNDLDVFIKIVIPLSMACIAAFTLFFAVTHWNTYFQALIYISDNKKRTIQVLLKSLVLNAETSGVGTTNDVSLPKETIRLAAVVLAMLPIVIIYPFLQKYFVKGVMLGSVKG